MKKVEIKPEYIIDNIGEAADGTIKNYLIRVGKALNANGYEASEEDCFMLWLNYSKTLMSAEDLAKPNPFVPCAVPPSTPDEIFALISPFIAN